MSRASRPVYLRLEPAFTWCEHALGMRPWRFVIALMLAVAGLWAARAMAQPSAPVMTALIGQLVLPVVNTKTAKRETAPWDTASVQRLARADRLVCRKYERFSWEGTTAEEHALLVRGLEDAILKAGWRLETGQKDSPAQTVITPGLVKATNPKFVPPKPTSYIMRATGASVIGYWTHLIGVRSVLQWCQT